MLHCFAMKSSIRRTAVGYGGRSAQLISMAATDTPPALKTDEKRRSAMDQLGAAGLASAAVVAAAAVNSAVGMRTLQAPDADQTYVFKDGASSNRTGKVDEYGLPLVYDKDLIQQYWKKQGYALTQRWTEFLGYAVPFLTKMITLVVSGGSGALKDNAGTLAKDARIIFEKLGPTYVKMGQMMSVRPDVLPEVALTELKLLQDSVKPFDSATAIRQIESELGCPLDQVFSEISEEPVAAASLAQVYKARLLSTGEVVAVKIQRPHVLEVVSKDLYVLRRAAEVYQGLMDRFAPQQRTNYVALLNEWAVGFYTELDFLNEAANQQRLKDLLVAEDIAGMYIPEVYHQYCTRRVLVSEWIDGIKLSECSQDELRSLIPDAQESFLTQLLQVGFFHSDPHPGNMIRMKEPRGQARIALIDFGLVASIKQRDMDTMVSAIIHLANRDFSNLVDDFISLGILPEDCDRVKVVPLMDKALTPYVKGGGATKYEAELRKTYGMDGTIRGSAGGFQQMTQDALTVLNDIPFSIPPYFALLGRAIVTLEGVALSGDPNYGIIMESYPFVARKLLKEDRPEIQKALQQLLYAKPGGDGASGLQGTRLSALLNSALGVVAKSSSSFIDFDSIPEDSVDISTSLKFILSPSSKSLRSILVEESVTAGDILLRQAARKVFQQVINSLPRPPLFGQFLPRPEDIAIPFLIPREQIPLSASYEESDSMLTLDFDRVQRAVRDMKLTPKRMTAKDFLEISAPKLSREEELYAISLTDLATQTLGRDAGMIINGNMLLDLDGTSRMALRVLSSGQLPFLNNALFSTTQISSFFQSLRGGDQGGSSTGGVDELVAGVSSLPAQEAAVLQNMVNTVLLRLNNQLIDRLKSHL